MSLLSSLKGISAEPYNDFTVIMGKPGSGKTTLAGTYPKPMLYVAVGDDGGGVVLKHYGDDSIKLLKLKSDKDGSVYNKLLLLIAELKEHNGYGFKSLVIDAYTSIEEDMILVAEKRKGAKLSLQERGNIGTAMTNLRDEIVNLSNSTPLKVVAICHTKNIDSTDSTTGEAYKYIIPKMSENNGRILLERASNVVYCVRRTVKNDDKLSVEFLTFLGAHPNIDTKLRTEAKNVIKSAYIKDCTFDKIESVCRGEPFEEVVILENNNLEKENENNE